MNSTEPFRVAKVSAGSHLTGTGENTIFLACGLSASDIYGSVVLLTACATARRGGKSPPRRATLH